MQLWAPPGREGMRLVSIPLVEEIFRRIEITGAWTFRRRTRRVMLTKTRAAEIAMQAEAVPFNTGQPGKDGQLLRLQRIF